VNTPEPNQPGAPSWPDAGPRTGGAQAGSGDGAGDAGLPAALSVLGGLPDLPVAEHAAVYDGLHEALLEALDADQEADAGADLMDPSVIDTTAGEA
jgi:hypothetical protein